MAQHSSPSTVNPAAHSHIHFPAGNQDTTRPGPSDAEGSRNASPLRKSVVKEGAFPSAKLRRSMDGANARSDRLRSKTLPSRISADPQLGLSPMKSKREYKGDKGRTSLEADVLGDELKPGAFSDEYDLCELFTSLADY